MIEPAHGMRYVTDVPYARRFVRELAPAWLDFAALVSGYAPPDRSRDFAWCELGCGQGVTAALLAATHCKGRFVGIDMMPEHIAHGRTLADAAGIDNLAFHALDFAAAGELELPLFDYIVAHGVYSWIDAGAKADLRRFLDRHLKPGGLVYLSYNALPGWAADAPMQHLLRRLADRQEGDSIARFLAAERTAAALAEAGATVLRSGWFGRDWDELRRRLPSSYFAHEFLAPAWQPLYVTEVRRDLAEIGLRPIGSATIRENFDSYMLRQAARDALAPVEDPDLRELMRDYFMLKRFRRDLFCRAPEELNMEATRRRLAEGLYMLSGPPQEMDYAMATEAGTVSFDNPVARRIVEFLGEGPGAPARLASEGHGLQDLIANILVLVSARRVWPVGPDQDSPERINSVLRERSGGSEAMPFVALPSGTAVEFTAEQMARFRDQHLVPYEFSPWSGLAAGQ